MVSPILSRSRKFPRQATALGAGLIAAILVMAAILGAVAWLYWAAHAALPQVEGALTVEGLSAAARVIRDGLGVPHIAADNLDDLYFTQGYVTAQDRLWEMDATRRYAAGEMAEIFGTAMVQHDREQRILGFRQVAERATAAVPARERAQLAAYARGVNAYIKQHRSSLPLEFRLLRYEPRPWRAEDAMLIYAHMAKLLNFATVRDLLAREKIAARLPAEMIPDLFPVSSWRDLPPTEMARPVDPSAPEPRRNRVIALEAASPNKLSEPGRAPKAEVLLRPHRLTPGSNNWALAGSRTQSGKPLLANDMHLPHQIPNVWYVAHLQCKRCVERDGQAARDVNVVGVTLPGVPWVIVGHNDRIAWGLTNLNPTVTDLYVERINESGRYETPQGWVAPERRTETIHVKGEPDVTVDVTTTRHGPIIRDLIKGESRALALRWTLYDAASTDIPFFDLNVARDWNEFRAGLSRFTSPSQNVVYADVDGNVGYQATGLIPIRAQERDGPAVDAVLSPVPGNADTNEWRGYISFDELPSVYDPRSGVLVTANGRIASRSYRYTLAHAWGPPYRTERIYRLLNSGKKFTADQMLAIQTDVTSEFDRFCAERFAYAVDRRQNASDRARQAASILRNWDGGVTADSAAPTLVAAARDHLMRMILKPHLDDEWQEYRWPMESVALEAMLLHRPPRWLPAEFRSWEELLAAALEAAVADGPRNLNELKWGRTAQTNLRHPVLAEIPLLAHIPRLRRWIGPGRYDQPGNGYTVLQTGHNFGPSMRMTVDLGDLDASALNLVNGQSGNPASEHFNDQWNAWKNGTSFPLPFTAEAVQKATVHELRLAPRKATNPAALNNPAAAR